MKIKYVPFKTKDGKVQHCPIVTKNRDVLIGHIMATQSILESLSGYANLDDKLLTYIDPGLDSSRFNNYLEDGLNCYGMTQEEVNEIMQKRVDDVMDSLNHKDNDKSILDPGFFSVDCQGCGNFVRWNSAKEIPYENFKCDICERVLVHYIHLDDEDIEFDEGEGNE